MNPPFDFDHIEDWIGIAARKARSFLWLALSMAGWPRLLIILVMVGMIFWMNVIERPFDMPPFTQQDEDRLAAGDRWPLVLHETFDGQKTTSSIRWATGVEEGPNYRVDRQLLGDRWDWSGDFTEAEDCCRAFAVWFLPIDDLSDFQISIRFIKVDGDKGSLYGIAYHYQNRDNFYLLDFNDVQNASGAAWVLGEWKAVFTPVPGLKVIRPFQMNTLLVSVEAGHVTVLINDQYIGQFDDNRIPRGQLGIVMGSPYHGGGYELGIDEITLRAPGE